MTRQLATLVGAGLPLVECLGALIEQVDNARQKRILSQVREHVVEGGSLADAMKQHPRCSTISTSTWCAPERPVARSTSC